MARHTDEAVARQGRQAALVIVAAAALSMAAPWITRATGLPLRYEMLFYFVSLAGFFWSLVVTWRIWQKTRQ